MPDWALHSLPLSLSPLLLQYQAYASGSKRAMFLDLILVGKVALLKLAVNTVVSIPILNFLSRL